MYSSTIFPQDILDILFAHRNKAYGAYDLRRYYEDRLRNALGIMLLLTAALVLLFIIITHQKKVILSDNISHAVELKAAPPSEHKVMPPPAPLPPKTLKVNTRKFVTPDVRADEAVPDDVQPPSVDNLQKAAIGKMDIEGKDADMPALIAKGDATGVAPTSEKKQQIFMTVEKMPEFPGGEDALMKYLSNHISYPSIASENNIEGTVVVSFIVDTEGNVTDVKTLTHVGGGCEQEAIKVVSQMPRWRPGMQNGRKVLVQYNLPIKFHL